MKSVKIILLYSFFFSIVSFLHIQSIENVALLSSIHAYLLKKAHSEGGFCGETKIKINDQFCKLNDLKAGDLIFSPTENNYQKIISKEELYLPYYFKITIDKLIIAAAPAQLFYDEASSSWIEAQNLTTDHTVGGCSIDQVLRVNSYYKIQKINVKDNLFIIERNNFLVHNEALALAITGGIQIGALVLINPIIKAIGRTISNQKIWNRLYKSFDLQETASHDYIYLHYMNILTEKTRSCYSSRRFALYDLLEKYKNMEQLVEMVIQEHGARCKFFNTKASLDQILSNQQKLNFLLPSFEIESKYSYSEKQKLLELRDKELAEIEKEIVQIQLNLGIYFNESFNHQNFLIAKLQSDARELKSLEELYAIKIKERHHNRECFFNEIVFLLEKRYQILIFIDAFLNYFLTKSQKLSALVRVYIDHPQIDLFRTNSNVLTMYSKDYYQDTITLPNIIKNHLQIIRSKLHLCEQLFNVFKIQINVSAVQSIIQKAKIEIEKFENDHNQNLTIKKLNIVFPSPPNDPEPDDDETSFFEKLKKRCKRKAKAPKGLMFEDPDTGLWWSKDIDRHGGSCYKVHQAMKRGFKWVMDADFFGKEIINKHKGSAGMFISYKDVVMLK